MIISKRKLNEIIDAERDKIWKQESNYRHNEEVARQFRELEKRIYNLEKLNGLIEEPTCPHCKRDEQVPNPIGF